MIKLGNEMLLESPWREQLTNKRIAVVSNFTGTNQHLKSTIDVLGETDKVQIAAIFAPEHGLSGAAQAGAEVHDEVHPVLKVPVYSLYGSSYKPTPEQLSEIDLILVEFQEVGVRFYTYLYTMSYVMQAAAELGIPVWVLDRPNPINGETVEGGMLEPDYSSFVGLHPVPVRTGLTFGELALYFNSLFEKKCQVEIIPMSGWRRSMWFDETGLPWVLASPNLPTLDSVTLYPGTCFFEGTNLSEGRGTTRPFEWIGAPWIDADQLKEEWDRLTIQGTLARPISFVPTFSKHKGEVCHGIQIHITDRNKFQPVSAGVRLLQLVKKMYPDHLEWTKSYNGKLFIDLLSGSDQLRSAIDQAQDVELLLADWEKQAAAFKLKTQAFHLYQ